MRILTAIVAAALVAAAPGIVSIAVSAFCAITMLLFTRCLSCEDAWAAIDKRLVVFLVTALATTGAAEFIVMRFVGLTEDSPAPLVLNAFLLISMLLNELLSNNVAAVIGTPIAIGIAEWLGAPIMLFVLAVLFGANTGYTTPMGYRTGLLVYTASAYTFGGFVRVGLPLQLVTWSILSLILATLCL